MEIRPVDIGDDDLMRQVYDVIDRAGRLDREHMPTWSFEEWLGAIRSPDSGERLELVAGYLPEEPDRVAGAGEVYLFLLDNLDKAWLEVYVDPPLARRGLGAALLDHVCRIGVADGRTLLMLDTKVPVGQVADHGYRRFAERHGFSFSNVEIVRHARCPVPEATLDGWAAATAAGTGDYVLRVLVDEAPPELAPSLGELMGQLAVDAPTGEVDFEEEKVTPERLAERLAMVRAMGRELFETVAVAEDGSAVAQTTLVAPTDGSTEAWQWGTFVHREHRGHRLGLAVKTANLRAMQTAHPEVRRISTQNAETNRWMVAINELMGFEPVEASLELVRRL